MKAIDTISKIKTLLGMEIQDQELKDLEVNAQDITLARMKLENGTEIEAEEFSAGKEVFIVTEDDRVQMPVGEYMLEDGRTVTVKEEGIIESIAAVESKEEVDASEETQTEAELDEHKKDEMEYAKKEDLKKVEMAIDELREEIKKLMDHKKEDMKKLSEVKQQLAETPATEPIKHSPESNTNDLAVHLAPNRRVSTLDRIMQKLS